MQDVYKKYESDVFGQKDSPVVVIDAGKVKKPDPTNFEK